VSGNFAPVIVTGDKKARGTMQLIVRNDGNAAFNGHVVVSVLASPDARADAGDVAVVQSDKRLKLKPGQGKSVKLKASMAAVPAGSYTLLGAATVDNLTSFAVGQSMDVQAPFVHLASGGTATPPGKPVTAGRKVMLSAPLRNAGNVATTRTPATYTLVFSTDGTDTVYQATATGRISLKPGQSKPQKVRFVLPGDAVAAGVYTLVLKVAAELNDANGEVVGLMPVTVV
jgi:hypothetical protein